MSTSTTKIFLLQLHCSSSEFPGSGISVTEEYTLVLNEHLTSDDFISDIFDLIPPPPTPSGTNPKLVLKVDGKYPMPPRQFLRHMTTSVPYSPKIPGGVCVPQLLGGGNSVEVIYGKAPEVKSVKEEIKANKATAGSEGASGLSGDGNRSKSSANQSTSADSKHATGSKVPMPQSPSSTTVPKENDTFPSHTNLPHIATVWVTYTVSTTKQEFSLDPLTVPDIPKTGGATAASAIVQGVLMKVPNWVRASSSNMDVKITRGFFGFEKFDVKDFRWDESAFSYSSTKWTLSLHIYLIGDGIPVKQE